jgi:hypothetical protein
VLTRIFGHRVYASHDKRDLSSYNSISHRLVGNRAKHPLRESRNTWAAESGRKGKREETKKEQERFIQRRKAENSKWDWYPNGNDRYRLRICSTQFPQWWHALIYSWRKAAAMPSKWRINSAAGIYARVAYDTALFWVRAVPRNHRREILHPSWYLVPVREALYRHRLPVHLTSTARSCRAPLNARFLCTLRKLASCTQVHRLRVIITWRLRNRPPLRRRKIGQISSGWFLVSAVKAN